MWLGVEIIIAFIEDIQKEDNYQKYGILFEYIFNIILCLAKHTQAFRSKILAMKTSKLPHIGFLTNLDWLTIYFNID